MKRSPLKPTGPIRRKEPNSDRPEHPKAKERRAVSLRTCAHCGKSFAPFQSMQKVCATLRCAQGFAKAQRVARERAERESFKARREAIKTIPQLTAKAQDAFNAYIRERDRHKGCFVCGKPFDQSGPLGGAMDAGHVRTRGAAKHLRFNEDNLPRRMQALQ